MEKMIEVDPVGLARMKAEAGCLVLLAKLPSSGPLALSPRQSLEAYKEQHGVEQNFGFLKDPAIINAIFLKKEEHIDALGLILLLALLITRLAERDLAKYT